MTVTTENETYTLERPTDISDARWEGIKARAHKVTTGHYAWCTDHEGGDDDGPDGYCQHKVEAWYGSLNLSSGTLDGVPLVWADLPDEGGHLLELEVKHAEALGEALSRLAQIARHSAGVPA